MAMIKKLVNKESQLVHKVENYEYRLNVLDKLPELKQESLDRRLNSKLNDKKFLSSRKLINLEKDSVPSEQLFEMVSKDKYEKLEKKNNLMYRAFRQKVYKEENILDKDYKVVKEVSVDGKKKIDDYKKQLAKELKEKYEAERKAYLSANTHKTAEYLAGAKKIYEEALAIEEKKLSLSQENLKNKYDQILKNYTKRQEDKKLSLQKKYTVAKEQLKKVVAATEKDTSAFTLPEDVILRLDNLSMHFGGLKAVDELSFDVKKGEIFGLIGPNGAGKTTVFNCITQFYKPTSGKVWYKNREGQTILLNDYKVHDVIKTGIVRTFQNVELIVEVSVLENLLIAAHTQYKTTYFAHMINSKFLNQEEAILTKKADKVLEYLDLLQYRDVPPVGLPYGILKRIELARTLMANANLIILDEPAAGLNDNETIQLASTIRKIAKDLGATIFLVEHDMGLVMDICDHICAISFGKKLAYGTPTEIQKDKVVQEAYLGSEVE
ncbi:MAG: ATP-binding cassette domain-containing protein [Bacilli bacterium]|nr:ATP-binding cassette domain-containing protein [Bacilli bacterium]